MIGVVAMLPALFAATGAVLSGWKTLTKARARRDLSHAVRGNAPDLALLNEQLNANDLAAATMTVRKHFAALPVPEQQEAESALTQPSPAGRAGYMRGIAGHAATAAPELRGGASEA